MQANTNNFNALKCCLRWSLTTALYSELEHCQDSMQSCRSKKLSVYRYQYTVSNTSNLNHQVNVPTNNFNMQCNQPFLNNFTRNAMMKSAACQNYQNQFNNNTTNNQLGGLYNNNGIANPSASSPNDSAKCMRNLMQIHEGGGFNSACICILLQLNTAQIASNQGLAQDYKPAGNNDSNNLPGNDLNKALDSYEEWDWWVLQMI